MLNREAVTSECLRIGDFQVLALALLILAVCHRDARRPTESVDVSSQAEKKVAGKSVPG